MSLKNVRSYSFLSGFCLLFLFIAVPHSALAHATPLSYSVATTTTSTQFSIVFSERIEPKTSALVFIDASGTTSHPSSVVSHDLLTLTASFPTSFSPVLGNWYVVSYDDGHFTRGSYPFDTNVSREAHSPATLDHSVSLVEVFFIFLELLGYAFLLGLCALGLFISFHPSAYPESSSLFRRLTTGILASSLLSLTGAIFLIGYKAYLISSTTQAIFTTTALSLVSTFSGSLVLYRMVASLLIIITVFLHRRRLRLQTFFFLCGFFTLAAITIRAFSSHAVASGFFPLLSGSIMTIHLFAKELWIGLCAVSIFFFSDFFSRASENARHFFLRFLNITTLLALLGGGVSGAYVIWLDAKSFEAFFTTAWGRECATLLLFGGAFLIVRLFNLFFAPRFSARLFSPSPRTQKSILGFTLPLEALIGVALLFFSSAIIITSPPVRSLSAHVFTDNPLRISSYPFNSSFVAITVPATTDAITVEAAQSHTLENSISLTPIRISSDTVLVSIAPLTSLPAPEPWTLSAIAHIPNAYDIHAETLLSLSALTTPRFSLSFTLWLIGAGCGIILFCLFLFRRLPRRFSSPYTLTLHEDSAWFFWLIIVGIFIFVFLGSHGGHGALLTSSFQRTCLRDGFVWEDAIPFQEGVPDLFGDIILGCSGEHMGHRFHITDFSHYRYFLSSNGTM